MADELIKEVTTRLRERKGEWRQIADALPGISYSWLSQVGRGKYKSASSYKRLKRVLDYLRGETKPKPRRQRETRAHA